MILIFGGSNVVRRNGEIPRKLLVDLDGFEPSTSSMPWKRSRQLDGKISECKQVPASGTGPFPVHLAGSGSGLVVARPEVCAA